MPDQEPEPGRDALERAIDLPFVLSTAAFEGLLDGWIELRDQVAFHPGLILVTGHTASSQEIATVLSARDERVDVIGQARPGTVGLLVDAPAVALDRLALESGRLLRAQGIGGAILALVAGGASAARTIEDAHRRLTELAEASAHLHASVLIATTNGAVTAI